MSFKPIAVSHSSFRGRGGAVPGSFVTAGAGVDPTDFDGAITKVLALSEGGVPFYRVTIREVWRQRLHTLVVTPAAESVTDDLTAVVGAFTADAPGPGPWLFTNQDMDIVLRSAGTPTAAAGHRVYISLLMDA